MHPKRQGSGAVATRPLWSLAAAELNRCAGTGAADVAAFARPLQSKAAAASKGKGQQQQEPAVAAAKQFQSKAAAVSKAAALSKAAGSEQVHVCMYVYTHVCAFIHVREIMCVIYIHLYTSSSRRPWPLPSSFRARLRP